jgi:hypothetical protein
LDWLFGHVSGAGAENQSAEISPRARVNPEGAEIGCAGATVAKPRRTDRGAEGIDRSYVDLKPSRPLKRVARPRPSISALRRFVLANERNDGVRPQVAIRPMAAVFLAALAAAMLASPILARIDPSGVQAAAATHRPDASIRVVKSRYYIDYEGKWFTYQAYPSWQGVGIYNSTATGQIARADWQYGCCNEKHTFSISIRNNGTASDRFTVKATGSGLSGWTVKYFKGTTNITSAVVAGTYQTPLIAPGGQFLMTAKMTGAAASETLAGSRLVTVASSADPTKKDAVKFQLHEATWCYC